METRERAVLEGARIYERKSLPRKGQLQFPKDLLDDLGIQPGDALYFASWKGWMLVIPEKELTGTLEDRFDRWAAG